MIAIQRTWRRSVSLAVGTVVAHFAAAWSLGIRARCRTLDRWSHGVSAMLGGSIDPISTLTDVLSGRRSSHGGVARMRSGSSCAQTHLSRMQKSPAIRWLSSLVTRTDEVLLCPRTLPVLLVGSFACASTFCLLLFPLQFLSGESLYWQAPGGLVGGSWADISQALSGYYYFVKDSWTLPLFQAAKLGVPHPVNIIFTDSIPILALAGRLLYRATGLTPNPFGLWVSFCFVASALSMTALVARLGRRSIAAALAATTSGLCMPALLYRWGHTALMAQWEISFALVLYVASRSCAAGKGVVTAALLLLVLSLSTNPYLFVMVTGILIAALLQAVIDRRMPLARGLMIFWMSLFLIVLLMAICGYFSTGGSVSGSGYGVYSLNPLSLLVPQLSDLSSASRTTGLLDATGGQYEGFSYVGGGVLLLFVVTLPWLWRRVVRSSRDHCCLAVLLLAYMLFAVTNSIYVGQWHVLTVPLPGPVITIAGIFRSSGRFVWPGLYLLTAIVIVATTLVARCGGAWLLMMAAILQFVDTGPLREALAHRISHAAVTPLAESQWSAAIGRHDVVWVVPSYGCMGGVPQKAMQSAIEIQLLASRNNVATNTVYAARHDETCAPIQDRPLGARELRVYLLTALPASITLGDASDCASSPDVMVCSRVLRADDLKELVVSRRQG